MRIIIDSTPELAHANGLPVRIWTGKTQRGIPITALITRIAVPLEVDADELEDITELAELVALTEAPTRVVDPSGSHIASPRFCTACIARGVKRPATHVARDPSGLEWYECGSHAPTDNVAETRRVSLEPIAAWFDRHEMPVPGGAVDRKLAELAAECRSLRERLKERGAAPWLVKDFWVLYQAAAATLQLESTAEAKDTREALRVQMDRLRPAFEVCEGERLGAPDRLTPAEHFALAALHRWLHSPNGDCDLIESAQLYHEQVEAESPAECERIEADEKRLFRAAMLDAAVAGSSRVSVALAAECGSNEPLLPHAVITAIVDNEHAGDPATGQPFILNAMRGAQHGWHARHAHPDRVAEIARKHAPIGEPARSAWLTGYRLSADGVVAAAAAEREAAEAETPTAPPVDDVAAAAEPFELTDGHREHYYKRLVYRAPELFTALERKIAAAIRAEQAERNAEHDAEWFGGER